MQSAAAPAIAFNSPSPSPHLPQLRVLRRRRARSAERAAPPPLSFALGGWDVNSVPLTTVDVIIGDQQRRLLLRFPPMGRWVGHSQRSRGRHGRIHKWGSPHLGRRQSQPRLHLQQRRGPAHHIQPLRHCTHSSCLSYEGAVPEHDADRVSSYLLMLSLCVCAVFSGIPPTRAVPVPGGHTDRRVVSALRLRHCSHPRHQLRRTDRRTGADRQHRQLPKWIHVLQRRVSGHATQPPHITTTGDLALTGLALHVLCCAVLCCAVLCCACGALPSLSWSSCDGLGATWVQQTPSAPFPTAEQASLAALYDAGGSASSPTNTLIYYSYADQFIRRSNNMGATWTTTSEAVWSQRMVRATTHPHRPFHVGAWPGGPSRLSCSR